MFSGASCGPDGCGGDPFPGDAGILIFSRPSGVLASRIVGAGQTVTWGEASLSTPLTSTSLDPVTMSWEGVLGRRSDAYAFVDDLAERHADLRDAAFQGALYERESDLVEFNNCRSNGGVRLPYSGNGDPRTVNLFDSQFFTDLGLCESPDPNPTVKSAAVYDRGLCWNIQDLQPNVDALTQTAWDNLVQFLLQSNIIEAFGDDVDRKVWRAVSYVAPCLEVCDAFRCRCSPDSGAGPAEVRGGIVLVNGLDGILGPMFNDLHLHFATDLQLKLDDDGILAVDRDDLYFDIEGGGLIGEPGSNAGVQELIRGEIDDRINGQIDAIGNPQRVNLVPADTTVCLPPGLSSVPPVDQCSGHVFSVSFAVATGAGNMNSTGVESFSSDEVAALVASTLEPSRWTCGADFTCRFKVPAKRMNFYPDAVELVFFDGKEVDNAAYALFVAAHQGTNPNNWRAGISAICPNNGHPFTLPTNNDGRISRYARQRLAPCSGCLDQP